MVLIINNNNEKAMNIELTKKTNWNKRIMNFKKFFLITEEEAILQRWSSSLLCHKYIQQEVCVE